MLSALGWRQMRGEASAAKAEGGTISFFFFFEVNVLRNEKGYLHNSFSFMTSGVFVFKSEGRASLEMCIRFSIVQFGDKKKCLLLHHDTTFFL